MKGIAEEAFKIFLLQPASDFKIIRSSCEALDEARQQRIHLMAPYRNILLRSFANQQISSEP